MNEEDITKLLEMTLHSEDSPELNDAVVDAFLAIETKCPPEKTERVRARFVEKILSSVHCEPVQRVDKRWSFGRWIEATRESVRLTREDVATALHKDFTFVEKVEKGESLPWKCHPSDIADVVCLFRVHMDAVQQLVVNTVAVNQIHGLGSVSARSRSGLISSDRGETTKRALDMFLAHHAAPATPDTDVSNWLNALRDTLQQRGADYLLGQEGKEK